MSSSKPGVVDVVNFSEHEVDVIEERRQEVYNRLNKLNKEREAAKIKRKQDNEKQKGTTRQDNIAEFNRKFAIDTKDLKAFIENINATDSNYKENIDECRDRLKKLTESVSSVAYFLPPYDVRTSKETLKSLNNLIENTENVAVPKKKFSFRKRKKKKPTVAAAAAATTTTVTDHNVDNNNNTSKNILADVLKRAESNVVRIFDRHNEDIILDGDVAGKDISITNVTNCNIKILYHLGAVRVDNITNCNMILGAVAGSVFMEHVKDSQFYYASRQTRIHDTHGCKFHLLINSNPIIEDATNVGFAPCDIIAHELVEAVKLAGINEQTNKWDKVEDFKWLRQQQSPNWYRI